LLEVGSAEPKAITYYGKSRIDPDEPGLTERLVDRNCTFALRQQISHGRRSAPRRTRNQNEAPPRQKALGT